jgi:hypothetical protein
MKTQFLAAIALSAAWLGGTTKALATNNWQAGDGKWETGANWDEGTPSLLDGADVITNTAPAGGGTITIDAMTTGSLTNSLTINNLLISSAPGSPHTLSLNGAGLFTPLHVLYTLSISNGARVSVVFSMLQVGPGPSSFFVDDGDLLFNTGFITTTNALTLIGNSSQGTATVSNGAWQAGEVDVGRPNATGTLSLAGGIAQFSSLNIGLFTGGTGAVWMTGGQLTAPVSMDVAGGVGRMTISNGTWVCSGLLDMGSGSGTLTVAGGTIELSESMFVGGGTGNVWMTGGIVSNSGTMCSVYVGSGGVGLATVSNGTWLSDEMVVGNAAQGTFTIAGGTVTLGVTGTSPDFTVGVAPGGTGTVWLTGGQFTLTNGPTRLGTSFGAFSNAVGRMTVSNGVWRARDVSVAADPDAQGTLTITGGTCSIYSNLTVGNFDCTPNGAVFVKGGSLFVTNAAHNAVLEVRDGNLEFSSGTLTADILVMTNVCGRFVRTGGTLSITSMNLDPDFDADGDGIPNGWEIAHGLDPLDDTTGVQDTDGDGLNNFVEYVLGTDPRDAHDPFRVTAIAREGNDIRVTWQYCPPPGNDFGHCIVEASSAVTGTWNSVSSTFTLPSDFFIITSTNFVETGGATNKPSRFYRVRLVP